MFPEEEPFWQRFAIPRPLQSAGSGSALATPDTPLFEQFKKPRTPTASRVSPSQTSPGSDGFRGPVMPKVVEARRLNEQGRALVNEGNAPAARGIFEEADQIIAAERAAGNRPSLLDRAGPRVANQALGIQSGIASISPSLIVVDKIARMLGFDPSTAGVRERLQAEIAAQPQSEDVLEKVADFGSTAAPHVAMGMATAPAQGVAMTKLLAQGVRPLLARAGGALAQEVALAPATFGASESIEEGAMNMLAGAAGGAVFGGGGKSTIDSLPSPEDAFRLSPEKAYADVQEIVDPAAAWRDRFPAVEHQDAGANAFIRQKVPEGYVPAGKPTTVEDIEAILAEADNSLPHSLPPDQGGPLDVEGLLAKVSGDSRVSPEQVQYHSAARQAYLDAAQADTPLNRSIKQTMDTPVELERAYQLGENRAYYDPSKRGPEVEQDFTLPRHTIGVNPAYNADPVTGTHAAGHELGHGVVSDLPDAGHARTENAKLGQFPETPLNMTAYSMEKIRFWKQADAAAQKARADGDPAVNRLQSIADDAKDLVDQALDKTIPLSDQGTAMQLFDAVNEGSYLGGGPFKGYGTGKTGTQHTAQEKIVEGLARYTQGDPSLEPRVTAKLDKLTGKTVAVPPKPVGAPPEREIPWELETGPRQIPDVKPFPKVTAGETAPGMIKSNVRLDKFEDADAAVQQEVRQRIENTASANPASVNAARRGIISDEEVTRAGQLLGVDSVKMKEILGQKDNVALNESELRALGEVLHSSSNQVDDLAKKVSQGTAHPDQLISAIKLQYAAQMRAHAAWATAGRALRSLRTPFKGLQKDQFERMAAALEDPVKMKALAGQLASMGPEASSGMIRNIATPDFWDKLFEYRVSNMLSVGYGMARNFLSNSAMAIKLGEEEFTSTAIDTVRTGGGLISPRNKTFAGALKGTGAGLKQIVAKNQKNSLDSAVNIFWKSFKNEESAFRSYADQRGIRTQGNKLQDQRAIAGVKGRVLRTGVNVMNSTDQMNKTVLYSSKLEQLIFEKARKAGRLNDQQYVKSLYSDKQLVNDASRFADMGTFTDRDSTVVKLAQQFRNIPGMRWVTPFATTTTNVLRQGAARLPVAGYAVAAKDIAMGARGAAASEALAKPLVPTALALWIGSQVQGDKITGGKPTAMSSKRSGEQFPRAAGWQPYSIMVGDRYVSYQAVAPVGTVLGAIVDYAQAAQAEDKSAMAATLDSLINTTQTHIVGESMLRDIYDYLATINETGERREEVVGTMAGQFASGFIPFSATLGAVARGTDDTARDTVARGGSEFETAVRQVQGGIPGLRDDLPAKEDTFGRPMTGIATSGMLRSSKINRTEMATLMRADELAGYKRTLPAQGRKTEDMSPADLLKQASGARKYLDKLGQPETTQRQQASMKEDRKPDTQEVRELLGLKERLYKTELNLAVEANDKTAFKAAWKQSVKAGFRFANGEPVNYWRNHLRRVNEE